MAKRSPDYLPTFDLAISLSEEERARLGRGLKIKIREAVDKRSERDDRIRSWRDQYEAVAYQKTFPWPNSASINVPTTRSIVDTIHARAIQAMGVDPLFRTEATQSVDSDLAGNIEHFLQWQMTEQVDMRDVWDRAVFPAFRDGNSVVKVYWKRLIGRDLDIEDHVDDQGRQGRALVETEKIVCNQPEIEVIDILDWMMYPVNALSIKTAIGCGHRTWKTKNDLLIGVKSEIYDQEAVTKLFKSGASKPQTYSEYVGGDESATANVGLMDGDASEYDEKPYEVWELLWLYDADGDGIKEDCLFTLEFSTGTLLRAVRFPYLHRHRHFVDYTPYPRPRSFYGYSVPEILEGLHAEINAIRNQRVDAGTLANSPMLAVKRGTKWDPNKERYRPGGVIYLDDPKNDIIPVNQFQVVQSAFAEEQKAAELAEKVTGVSDYAQGASPSRSRTLGEVNSVLAEGNVKFNVVIRRLHKSNTEIARQVLGLDRQYLDAKTEFAVMGENAARLFMSIERSAFATNVRIVPHGNSLNSNKEIELQSAETLYQLAQTNPLIGQNLLRMYAVTQRYLNAMGISNVAPYIGTEQEAKQQMQAEASQPPQGPPPNISGKADELTTLTLLMKEGKIAPQDLIQAKQVYDQTAGAEKQQEVQARADAAAVELDSKRQAAAMDLHVKELTHAQKIQQLLETAHAQREAQGMNPGLSQADAALESQGAQPNSAMSPLPGSGIGAREISTLPGASNQVNHL